MSQQRGVLTRLLIIMRALGSAGVIAQAEVQTLASLFRGLAGEVGWPWSRSAISSHQPCAVLRTMQLMARAVATFARANPQIVLAAGISGGCTHGIIADVGIRRFHADRARRYRAPVGASFIVFTGQ